MQSEDLPLSPAPSPIPSMRVLRIRSPPQAPVRDPSEQEILDLYSKLNGPAQSRVLKELLRGSTRDTLLDAKEVIEPRLRHDPFRVLPFEISLRILSYIADPQSLAAAAQVSRLWYFLLRDDSTWKQMCHEHHFRRLSAAGSYVHQWRPNERIDRANSQVFEDTPPRAQSPRTISSSRANSVGNTAIYESSEGEQTTPQPTLRSPFRSRRNVRRNSLLHLANIPEPLIQYGLRLPNFDQAMRRHMAAVADPEVDPIGEAYYDPEACVVHPPDSYRSHFRQQYVQSQAWAAGGRLAGRYSLPNHADAIVTCVLMQDGYIVVALDTSLILVFRGDGQLVRSLYGHVMGVWTLALRGHTLVSGGCDRDIREWDLNTGQCIKIMRGHSSTVRCLAIAPGSEPGLVVSGSRDTTVRIWDLRHSQALHVLCGHSSSVRRVEFGQIRNEDGTTQLVAVSASYDATAKVWNVEMGTLMHTLSGHANQIYALSVQDGRVVTGSLDHTIRVWDLATGTSLGVLTGHTALVGQLVLQNSLLVSGGSDGSVRVWDLKRMRCIHRIAAHDNTVSCLSLTGDRVVTGGPDCQVAVWNVRTGKLVRMFQRDAVTFVWAVAADEDRLLTVYSEGSEVVVELMSFVPNGDAEYVDVDEIRSMSQIEIAEIEVDSGSDRV